MFRRIYVCSISLILCVASLAQCENKPGGSGKRLNDANAITAAIKSDDNFQIQQALDSISRLLADEKNGKKGLDELSNWLKLLRAQKRYDEVETVAFLGICAQAASLPDVQKYQEARVRANLAAGRPKEALALAKGYYNVCAMPDTSHAIELLSECLYDVNADHEPAAIVKKLRQQQLQGASISATQPSPGQEPLILSAIRIDPKPYEQALASIELDDSGFATLLAKGNLLLLADRPKEAKKFFDKAYALATDRNLVLATESVARAMRAEDGTVGRANNWILSLRPEEGGQ